MEPLLSPRGHGEVVPNPVGGEIELKAGVRQTGGSLSAFESVAAPGEGPPLHLHEDVDEILYFVSGKFRVQIDVSIEEVEAGTFMFVPRLTPHAWQNVGDEEARLLAIFVPGSTGMESFFSEFAAAGAGVEPAATFSALAAEAKMRVVGAPIGARTAQGDER